LNVLSLFDGCSCGRVALERAGFKIDTYRAFEIDKYAIQIAQKNYPSTIQSGDVLDSDFSNIKRNDLLLGGSPCTFWSIAKQGRDVDKTGMGWKLFERYLLALKNTKPKYFLYENVASMPIQIKDFVSEEFGVQPILINSDLVSAQQRKRLYWTNIPGITQPTDKSILLQDIIEDGFVDRKKSYCIDASYFKGGNLQSYYAKSRRQLVFVDREKSRAIISSIGRTTPREYFRKNQGQLVFKFFEENQIEYRKLTPKECERLQTLPDNYTDGISDTQRYKIIGNGWTVDVISHILSFMKY